MVKSAHSCKTTGSSLMLSWLAYICISCDIAIYHHNLWHVNIAGIGFCHPKKTNCFPFSLRKKKSKTAFNVFTSSFKESLGSKFGDLS